MICQECGVNEAQIVFKQLLGNKITQGALCRDCAQRKGLAPGPDLFLEMLSSLGMPLARPGRGVPAAPRCASCGIKYAEFRETGRLGCAGCYESFKEPLSELLRRFHGALEHKGKSPV